MILNANKPIEYKRNSDILKDVFKLDRPNIKKAIYIFPNNSNYMIWFNYEAKRIDNEQCPGKPGNSNYINIYKNNGDEILQIAPKGIKARKEYDNKIRITFKKTNGSIIFSGLYKLKKRKKNTEYYIRISKKFDPDSINRKRVLFCNIAYMSYYQGISSFDKPINGELYVNKYNDAYEKYNFAICKDGSVRGFVETGYRDGYKKHRKPRKILIENIDSNYIKCDEINNVLVIFCARNVNKETVVVGWYKDATVFRTRKYEKALKNRMYNILSSSYNSFIVPEEERKMLFPREKEKGYGFGQTNFAYLNEKYNKKFINKLFNYIDNNSKDSYRLSTNYKYYEKSCNKGRNELKDDTITTHAFRRYQSRFRNELLNRKNKCELCNINDEKLLIASHIKPYSKCNINERIDYNNGLLLCALHDALFDKYLISFNTNGKIMINNKIKCSQFYKNLGLKNSTKISINKKMNKYMEYHRKKYHENNKI